MEVNDDAGDMMLQADFTAPSFGSTMFLDFWAGIRSDVGVGTVEIQNVTDATTILAPTTIAVETTGNPNPWEFNEWEFLPFSSSDMATPYA